MSSSYLRRFGSNLRRLRIRQGLSQEELAERSASHTNYIGGIERGERNPSVMKIVAIAKALHCGPADLFRESE